MFYLFDNNSHVPFELVPVIDSDNTCLLSDLTYLAQLNANFSTDLPLYNATPLGKDCTLVNLRVLVDTGASEC